MCFRNKPTPPPPLPPHAVPLKAATKDVEDDYRPPVPPHRNIGSGETPKKHHHHHHHRNSKNHEKTHRSGDMNRPGSGQDDVLQETAMRSVFEFDDEPHESQAEKMENEEKMNFVQYPRSPNSSCMKLWRYGMKSG